MALLWVCVVLALVAVVTPVRPTLQLEVVGASSNLPIHGLPAPAVAHFMPETFKQKRALRLVSAEPVDACAPLDVVVPEGACAWGLSEARIAQDLHLFSVCSPSFCVPNPCHLVQLLSLAGMDILPYPPPPLVISPHPLQSPPPPWWGNSHLGPKSTENARRQRKFLQGAETDLRCDTMVQFCGAIPPSPRGNRHFVTPPPPQWVPSRLIPWAPSRHWWGDYKGG